jgi:excinuclease ABC subunit B
MSGRKDVIVVSSVSCLYGIGNPDDFHANVISVKRGDKISRNQFLRKLVDGLYSRNETEFDRGHFRVKGDTVDINLAYADHACRISFWGDEIESIETFDPVNNLRLGIHDELLIYPANIFVTSKERINQAMRMMQDDLVARVEELKRDGKKLEAKRLEERVNYDMEMIKELGYCSGIENYSRYFDGRAPGTRPFCLIDFFPDDFITIIDESHVTIPQIRAMYGGDYSRKRNLVDYGFRLPAALDNRPLRFEEFEELAQRVIYVSATPAEYEIEKSEGIIVEQLIRPTGLPDPRIEVRPSLNQIDDLMEEIRQRCARDERVLVTTLTKRMAEELTDYLTRMGVRCQYIHSDVETLERVKIMEALREGMIDVLVGVNLLREGLDLPEVSLVAILDADKEGFLRSARSLTQTAGRAARNINGLVIMYADTITGSMQETIDATNYRREKQLNYNKQHGITPTPIVKKRGAVIPGQTAAAPSAYVEPESVDVAADPVVALMSPKALEKAIDKAKRNMEAAAKELDFMAAAFYRDEMFRLQELLKEKKAEEKK